MASAILKLVHSHALASRDRFGSLRRWAVLRLRQSISAEAQIVTYAEGARLHAERCSTTTAVNHICGLRDYAEMMLLLHVSRPDDLVLDLGANVGTYSVLAAYCAKASVIAVEPAPKTVNILHQNLYLNGIAGQVRVVASCVSSVAGTLQFSASEDTINHVATDRDPAGDKISVDATTIDDVCATAVPLLIKIDIEGYELPALRGGARTINDPRLKIIIIEVNASGRRYGFEAREVDELLSAAGFAMYSYDPAKRSLEPGPHHSSENRIYVRDIEWVRERVESARQFKIYDFTV